MELPFSYTLIRARRKTVQLRVGPDGQVILRAPQAIRRAQADAIVLRHQDWIQAQIARQQARQARRRRVRCTARPSAGRPARTHSRLGQADGRMPGRRTHHVGGPALGQLFGPGPDLLFLPGHATARGAAGIYRRSRAGAHPPQEPQRGILRRGKPLFARLLRPAAGAARLGGRTSAWLTHLAQKGCTPVQPLYFQTIQLCPFRSPLRLDLVAYLPGSLSKTFHRRVVCRSHTHQYAHRNAPRERRFRRLFGLVGTGEPRGTELILTFCYHGTHPFQ